MAYESRETAHTLPAATSLNGRVHHEAEEGDESFFSSPEMERDVLASIKQFVGGVETVTLEQLRSEVAQSSKLRKTRVS